MIICQELYQKVCIFIWIYVKYVEKFEVVYVLFMMEFLEDGVVGVFGMLDEIMVYECVWRDLMKI